MGGGVASHDIMKEILDTPVAFWLEFGFLLFNRLFVHLRGFFVLKKITKKFQVTILGYFWGVGKLPYISLIMHIAYIGVFVPPLQVPFRNVW